MRRPGAARGISALLLALVLTLGGCAGPVAQVVPVGASPTAGYGGVFLDQPYTLPDATLTDQDGRSYALRTGSAAPVLVLFFGYTNCPDICKSTLADLAGAVNRLDPAARGKVQVVLITVDPARDDPATLKSYLARFDPSFIGLTASPAEIKAVAATMGVAIEGTTKTATGYDVTHSDQLLGFDAERRGRLVWTQGTSIGVLRADLERLAAAQP